MYRPENKLRQHQRPGKHNKDDPPDILVLIGPDSPERIGYDGNQRAYRHQAADFELVHTDILQIKRKKLVNRTTVPYTKKLNHFREAKVGCLLLLSRKLGTPFPPDAMPSMEAPRR